jgi:hypothetical protein
MELGNARVYAMGAIQMTDLLAKTREFHRSLAGYYDQLSHEVHRNEVKQVVDFIGRHERHLERCLGEYGLTMPDSVRNAWFRAVPELHVRQLIEEALANPDMSVEDVTDLAVRFDDCLIKLYRHLAEECPPGSLREALEGMLTFEAEEEKQFLWDLRQD